LTLASETFALSGDVGDAKLRRWIRESVEEEAAIGRNGGSEARTRGRKWFMMMGFPKDKSEIDKVNEGRAERDRGEIRIKPAKPDFHPMSASRIVNSSMIQ